MLPSTTALLQPSTTARVGSLAAWTRPLAITTRRPTSTVHAFRTSSAAWTRSPPTTTRLPLPHRPTPCSPVRTWAAPTPPAPITTRRPTLTTAHVPRSSTVAPTPAASITIHSTLPMTDPALSPAAWTIPIRISHSRPPSSLRALANRPAVVSSRRRPAPTRRRATTASLARASTVSRAAPTRPRPTTCRGPRRRRIRRIASSPCTAAPSSRAPSTTIQSQRSRRGAST